MTHHLRNRFATTFTLVWVCSVLMGMFAGTASAAIDPSCNGVLSGPDGRLNKSAVNADTNLNGFLDAGEVVTVTLTWDPQDFSGGTLNRIIDCVEVNGRTAFSIESPNVPNTGIHVVTYTPGSDFTIAAGDVVCDRAKMDSPSTPGSIVGVGNNNRTNKVCLNVTPAPTTGTIKIEKNVTGANASTTEEFGFQDTIPAPHVVGDLSDTDGVQTYSTVAPGTYTVTEDADPSADWDLTDLDCSGDTGTVAANNSTVDLTAREASINLQAGETITCVFENTYTDPTPTTGTIKIKKEVAGTGADQTLDFGFDDDITTGTPSNDVADQSHNDLEQTISGVTPGIYSVTEDSDPTADWDLTDIDCEGDSGPAAGDSTVDIPGREASINLQAGETITCVFENTYTDPTPTTGTIKIEKDVTGANASTTEEFGFQDTIPAPHVVGDLSDTDGVQTYSTVAPGTYTVTEDADPSADWDLTDLDCSGDTGTVAANNSTVDLTAREASINLQAGETITCVFENTYTAPQTPTGTVKIKKAVAGVAADKDLDFTFNDTIPTGNVSPQSHNDVVQTFNNVPLGNYSVTETNLPTDWALTGVTCFGDADSGGSAANGASIDVDANDVIECTFTNTYTAPAPPCCLPADPSADVSLTKTDLVDPVTAGANITYTVSVTNNGPDTAAGVTVTDTLPVGTGFVSASPSIGTCNNSSPISCSLGDLASGQNVTITVVVSTTLATPASVTNSATSASSTADPNVANNSDDETTSVLQPLPPEQGRIVLEKQTLPNRSGETFEFTGDLAATLGDGQTAVLDVDAGTYAATEVAEEGWELSGIECDDGDSSGDVSSATATFVVAEGETVKCTFTNTEEEVLGEIITKDPDPSKPKPEVLPSKTENEVRAGVLPFTGSDPSSLLALAGLMMLSGAAAVLLGGRNEELETTETC